MSDGVSCCYCNAYGSRRRETITPEGWLFLEAFDQDNSQVVRIAWACSERCALALWKKGPGSLDLQDPDDAFKLCDAPPAFPDHNTMMKDAGIRRFGRCPKCGWEATTPLWRSRGKDEKGRNIPNEHFDVTCDRCCYEWLEETDADDKHTSKPK